MELRAYWSIIWRRIWVVALVFGIVLLYAGYQYYHLRKTPGALKAYRSDIILQIGLQAPSQSPTALGSANSQSYSDYVTAMETLADEYTVGPVLTSNEFATQVYQQVQADRSEILHHCQCTNPDLGQLSPGAIGQALTAGRYHALVTVSATWPTSEGAWAIATAVGEVTTARISQYVDYVVRTPATPAVKSTTALPVVSAKVITSATNGVPVPGPSASKQTLLVALLLVGLIIGIALAFLIDYLDDRIRGREDALDLLQLPVYGEIPRAPTLGQSSTRRTPTS